MNKKIAAALFLLLFTVNKVSAQVSIAPIMLAIDQQDRFGTLLVMNGSEQPQEISIEFPFGYPVTDKKGNIEMIYDDSAKAERWAISEQIRGFPTNFTLQPGQRQVVRLMIQPDSKFKNGMYWSRIRTTSTPQSPEVGESKDGEITTQISYKFEQVTAVFYKYGDVTTGIDIESIRTNKTDAQLQFIIDSKRTGNAPFLGSILLEVTNSNGETVVERKSSTSIYFDYRQIFEIDRSSLAPGSYSAKITFVSERTDVSQSDLVQINPVSQSIDFQLK